MLGPVQDETVGSYDYSKKTKLGYPVPCRVFIYPLLVTQHTLAWREQTERSFKWLSLSDSAEQVDEDGVGRILGDLAADDGARLHDFVEQSMAKPAPTLAGRA